VEFPHSLSRLVSSAAAGRGFPPLSAHCQLRRDGIVSPGTSPDNAFEIWDIDPVIGDNPVPPSGPVPGIQHGPNRSNRFPRREAAGCPLPRSRQAFEWTSLGSRQGDQPSLGRRCRRTWHLSRPAEPKPEPRI